ncbi:MAG: ATP-binding protein [Verrucomicrobia subdivision 3 bacterium]|nr:ATP-binding protein [Limisphaerales bacterium]
MELERALSAEERDYGLSFADALHSCLGAAIISIGPDRFITCFNDHAERLTHLSATHALNQSFDRLPVALRDVIEEVFRTSRAIEGRHVHVRDGDLRVSAYPLTSAISDSPLKSYAKAPGKGIGVVLLAQDLAPVQKLENNMRQLDRLASVGALSASMAHEIKNAMVAVRTFVDLLIHENPDADLAPIVGREMRRIDSIVSQMLRLAGPARPTFASLRLHSLLDHALRLVQHQLEGKQIRSRRDFSARTDLVRGDEYQLQQAFLNLFFNAIEAMGAGGQLTVKTEMVSIPAGIRVSVCDTGVGIPPENLGRLFDAFFTTKQHGTGLGLPITRRIIQEHRGNITVESETAKGTAFHVVLPI